VSNVVVAFRKPTIRFAHRVLISMAAIFGSFLIATA